MNIFWIKVGVDIFYFKGKDYLLLVDYYLKYLDIILFLDLWVWFIIVVWKILFVRNGILLELFLDNGLLFSCYEFKCFVLDWEFIYRILSFCYLCLNG